MYVNYPVHAYGMINLIKINCFEVRIVDSVELLHVDMKIVVNVDCILISSLRIPSLYIQC